MLIMQRHLVTETSYIKVQAFRRVHIHDDTLTKRNPDTELFTEANNYIHPNLSEIPNSRVFLSRMI